MNRGFNSWTNLAQDGRRLERIIKLCETMTAKHLEAKDYDLALAFIDRLIKASAQKVSVADIVLGISHTRKLLEKQLEQPKLFLNK